MELTWQQLTALSTFTLNTEVTRVRLMYGWTTKHRGRKSLFVAVWLRNKPGAQRIYQLPARSATPKRWRKPLALTEPVE